ncbi:hypothetical protein RFI_25300, partial [Reticulomyxa filosa]
SALKENFNASKTRKQIKYTIKTKVKELRIKLKDFEIFVHTFWYSILYSLSFIFALYDSIQKKLVFVSNMSKKAESTFQNLLNLPTLFIRPQCVLYKNEIIICGDATSRECYSYDIRKNEYKLVCSYPKEISLTNHCIVKLVNNNPNEITLLSFNGLFKQAVVMNYVSVWGNDKEIKSKNYNQWVPFTDSHNKTVSIEKDEDIYWGMRAIVGGSSNNLLFITYPPNNIDVFNLNTLQIIKHDSLSTNDRIQHHCFVLKPENGSKSTKKKTKMLLFCKNTGMSIEYDENNNTFEFRTLAICADIASLLSYAYVRIDDNILFFGGVFLKKSTSKSVYKYSIQENKWMAFQETLPFPLRGCVAILSEDNTYVHIIGGMNDEATTPPTHTKTRVIEWLKEEKKEDETEKTVNKQQNERQQNEVNQKINVCLKEENIKWMKWLKEINEKEKVEVIAKFEQLSKNDFEKWLLTQSKWKKDLKKDNVAAICASITSYIHYHSSGNNNEENKKEEAFDAYVTIEKRQHMIKMKELTFVELLRQSYNCLESKDFKKISNGNVKLELVGMKDNVIESDESVKREFENKKPTFKLSWSSFQQQSLVRTKTIKNAIVIMIAISEYNDNDKWKNLKNVRDIDVINFQQLFEQELKYEFVCNKESKMDKEDVQEFLNHLITNHTLHKNKKQYDAMIMIISGHGDDGDVLVTSDGKNIPIDELRRSFDCNRMESLKDCPKIFIIDACRGQSIPKSHVIEWKGNDKTIERYGHTDDGFLTIWSTTKGYKVANFSLFSKCMTKTVVSMYKNGCSLHQMMKIVRRDIQDSSGGEWYCVQIEDTTTYDIFFQAKKSV